MMGTTDGTKDTNGGREGEGMGMGGNVERRTLNFGRPMGRRTRGDEDEDEYEDEDEDENEND
jgi:hypothetical protein